MGKGKKKKFNKRNATTFVLMPRGADEWGPAPAPDQSPNVFVAVPPPNLKGREWNPELDMESDEDGMADEDYNWAMEKRDMEIGEFGFPDDGYDYASHFALMGGGTFIPAREPQHPDQFAETEKKIKKLEEERNAPSDGIAEPDIDALLMDADSVDPDWELQDDFVMRAMMEGGDEPPDEGAYGFADEDSDDEFEGVSTRGVVQFEPRHGNSLADQKVDHVMKSQYSDEYIGDLEEIPEEVMVDAIDDHLLEHFMDEFLEEQDHLKESYKGVEEEQIDEEDAEEKLAVAKTKELLRNLMEEQQDGAVPQVEYVVRKEKNEWDCESVLSTLSNAYNHPSILGVPSKPKVASNVIQTQPTGFLQMAEMSDDEPDEQTLETVNKGKSRSKNETAEEKRLRKAAVKAERKERRAQKSHMKAAYKKEKIYQDKRQAGSNLNNTTVIKM